MPIHDCDHSNHTRPSYLNVNAEVAEGAAAKAVKFGVLLGPDPPDGVTTLKVIKVLANGHSGGSSRRDISGWYYSEEGHQILFCVDPPKTEPAPTWKIVEEWEVEDGVNWVPHPGKRNTLWVQVDELPLSEEDRLKKWIEFCDGRMIYFQDLLDSDDDSEKNIKNTIKAADEARKMAQTTRDQYDDVYAEELDQFAIDLDEKVKQLMAPDPLQLEALEYLKRCKACLEDENYLPEDVTLLAEEGAGWVIKLSVKTKFSKERRDCEQYIPMLEAYAISQQIVIKTIVARKYKHMEKSFVKMKKWFKNHDVPQDEIVEAKRIYLMYVLARKHGLKLPETKEDLDK